MVIAVDQEIARKKVTVDEPVVPTVGLVQNRTESFQFCRELWYVAIQVVCYLCQFVREVM